MPGEEQQRFAARPLPLGRIIHRAGEERSEAGRKRSTDRLWELTEPTAGRCFDVSVCHSDRIGGWLSVLAGRHQPRGALRRRAGEQRWWAAVGGGGGGGARGVRGAGGVRAGVAAW